MGIDFKKVMARLEDIWGPDAAVYRPERWLDEAKRPTAYENPAFHCGPRQCLGKAFAELEAVYILVCLLKRYTIKVKDLSKVQYENSVTLPIKNGLGCYITRAK